jgi:Tfp pilus assembly protein PilX
MSRRPFVSRDERGASLVLAIAFMLVIGALAVATLSMITSGLNNRESLDNVRDREYGADAAIQYAIANVRTKNAIGGGPAVESCSSGLPASYSINGDNYHVDCQNALAVTFSGFLQRNVIFVACRGTSACNAGNEIIRAQVNYQAVGGGEHAPARVLRTWIQSWSVKT